MIILLLLSQFNEQKVISFLASFTRSINLARLLARSSLLIFSTRSALSTKRSASSPVSIGVSFIGLAIVVICKWFAMQS